MIKVVLGEKTKFGLRFQRSASSPSSSSSAAAAAARLRAPPNSIFFLLLSLIGRPFGGESRNRSNTLSLYLQKQAGREIERKQAKMEDERTKCFSPNICIEIDVDCKIDININIISVDHLVLSAFHNPTRNNKRRGEARRER
jgi:hypothetical protein